MCRATANDETNAGTVHVDSRARYSSSAGVVGFLDRVEQTMESQQRLMEKRNSTVSLCTSPGDWMRPLSRTFLLVCIVRYQVQVSG